MRHSDVERSVAAVDWVNMMLDDVHGAWGRENRIGNQALRHSNLTEIDLGLDLLRRSEEPLKDNTIIATAIPEITNRFHSVEDIGWYGSSYMLATSAVTLLYGRFYTFMANKWVYLMALFLFELGSLICGIAPSSIALLMGRAVAGLGAGGLLPGAILLITQSAPGESRPFYTGLLVSVYGVASVAGPLIGGLLTDQVSWRWCFYINLPCGAVTAVLVLIFVKDMKVPGSSLQDGFWARLKQLDLPGNMVFTSVVICLLLALEWGGSKYSWDEPRIIALFVVSGVLLLLFTSIQVYQKDNATIPFHLIKKNYVWGSVLYSFCIPGIFAILTYFVSFICLCLIYVFSNRDHQTQLPIWFQTVKGASPTMSGVMNIPLLLGTVIIGVPTSLAIARFGYITPFLLASSIVLSIGSGLMITLDVDASHEKWIGYQAMVGIGLGLGQQLPVIVVSTLLEPAHVPTGTVIVTFVQLLSGAIFVSVGQNLFQNQLISFIQLNSSQSEISASQVLAVGINNLRQHYSGEKLELILRAYNSAVTHTFFATTALSVVSIVAAVPIAWAHFNKK
ncbi:major facilitator superfamily domain-containing protein [Aspergillus carlsbadensis]|nr:major facilitator superfamily domain-containing protein [Aspergillus carlsbadensis]